MTAWWRADGWLTGRSRTGNTLGRWWRRRGLRSRVTLTAAAGLLVAFVAADLLLLGALRATLNRSVDDSAHQAADQIVALINSQPLPQPVPVTASTVAVQVISPDGRVIDGSAAADRMVPLLSPARAAALARSGQAVAVQGAPYDLPPVLLSVVAASAANGDIVIAAVPYSSADASLSVVGRALALGTPLLFVLFTWAIWLAVGSTLRPIALLRRGAASVSATGVPLALPVPVARDEVQSLALTLNDMLGRLALAQQRQRDLVSDTAHELRSPIASIRTQLEVALDHPAGQDWEATARDVHEDVLRLSRLAEDLLVLARLDERALSPRVPGSRDDGSRDEGARDERARVDAADLGEISVAVIRRYCNARVPVVCTAPQAPATEADVSRETCSPCEIPPCLVVGDRSNLDRVLVNLIDNAVRYASSQVTVSVRCTDEWAELTVTDDGPGVPAEDMERAFGRFTRLDNGGRSRDDSGGGAGLGLAIVRATAQAYGGSAHMEAASPSGLRAVVRLARPGNGG
ncbi:MAG: sensor histidine kinase [Trebonia sp.]